VDVSISAIRHSWKCSANAQERREIQYMYIGCFSVKINARMSFYILLTVKSDVVSVYSLVYLHPEAIAF
jgi:hypothetical protein